MTRPWKRSRRSRAPTSSGRPRWPDAEPLIALGIGIAFVIWGTIGVIRAVEGLELPDPPAIGYADRVDETDTTIPLTIEGENLIWVADTPIRADPDPAELDPAPARCRGCGETRNEPILELDHAITVHGWGPWGARFEIAP